MKNIFKVTSIVGVLAILALAISCSDGATPELPKLQCSLPQPTAGLMVKNIGTADEAAVAGKITITSGEGVVILWDVQGLSSGEIVSTPDAVVGPPIKLEVIEEEKEVVNDKGEKEKQKVKSAKGSMEFPVLKENVEFKLRTINTDKDLPCEEVVSSVSVEVTPEVAKPEVKKFEATPATINAGEVSQLCWEVAPEAAAVVIKDDADNTLTPPVETAEGSEMSASGSAKALTVEGETVPETTETTEAVEPTFKATGCVDVKPEKTTTYKLTARANNETVTAETTVSITQVEFKIVSFAANSIEGSLTLEAVGDVKFTWEVTPSEGVVVSIDNGVGDSLPAKGEAVVNVTENKIYTLTASLNGQILAKQLTVAVNRGSTAQSLNILLTSSATSVFAGEPVVLDWAFTGLDPNLATPAAEGFVITLVGPEGSGEVSGNSAEIKPVVSGAYSIEVAVNGGIYKSNVVNIVARRWEIKEANGSWSSVVALKDKDVAIFGSASNSASVLSFAMLTGGTIQTSQANYDGDFEKMYTKDYMKGLLSYYGPFAINAIAQDVNKGNRLYAAITGGILYSDGGTSWKLFDRFAMWKGPKEHPTCKGDVQKNESPVKSDLTNLKRVCDLLVVESPAGGDRLIAANDHGVYYVDGVDERIADMTDSAHSWHGGANKDPNVLVGKVVNALETYGDVVYAGAENGVWVSSDRGKTWESFASGDISEAMAIYAIATDGENKKIYAGGPDGFVVGTLGGAAEWKKTSNLADSGVVYSIVLDPVQSGTIYIATDNGVYVSRNFGENWANVSDTMGAAKKVLALSVNNSGSGIGIYAATAEGAYSSVEPTFSIIKIEPIAVQPIEPAIPASAINVLKSLAK